MKQVGKPLAQWRSRVSRWCRARGLATKGADTASAAEALMRVRAALGRTWGLIRRLLAALPGGVRPWIALVSLGFVMAVLIANGRELLQLRLDGQGMVWLALATGLTQVLDERRYTEIIMTRATVSVGEDIGFLPGTEEEKMGPWMGA